MTEDETLKELIEDLISAMEYHVEQTRPIHTTTVALQAAREALKALAQPQQEPKCGAIIEVFGKDWRLEYMSLPVGKHKLYTQQYIYTAPQPQMHPCAGRNCGSTNPNLHSAECFEDYEKATGMAQPEQEPVAYLCENAAGHRYFRWKKPTSLYKPIPLYARTA
jgi:hypothetical protein